MTAKVDLSDIAHFVRVAERESFSEAARALGVPTSTVSRGVARLEDALGVRLLERTTRKVVPTASGRALLAEAAAPLHSLTQATDRVAEFQDRPSGHLRVTGPSDLGALLGYLVAEFVDRYPSITVDLTLSNRHLDLVAEGFDVALRAGRLADSSLVARKVKDSQAHLFASPKYLETAPPLRAPADLANHRAVLFRSTGMRASWTLGNGPKRATVEVKGRISGDDIDLVRAATVAGEGIVLLPEVACMNEVEEGTLVRVLAPWAIQDASVSVVVPSNKHLPSRVEVFREFLVTRLSQCPEAFEHKRSSNGRPKSPR